VAKVIKVCSLKSTVFACFKPLFPFISILLTDLLALLAEFAPLVNYQALVNYSRRIRVYTFKARNFALVLPPKEKTA